MMRVASMLVVAALAATAASLGADTAAAPDHRPAECFRPDSFQSWRAPDAKTILIRVNHDRFYRLDLAASCPMLTWPESHLVTHFDGTNMVCRALDWNIRVAVPLGGSEFCIVKHMTGLSPSEAAAIPKQFKP
jgi:uncharacterized protein DUF6491